MPFLNWVAWLYAGLATRRPRYLLFALVYGAPWVAGLVLSHFGENTAFKIAAGIAWLLWLVGLVHVFKARREVALRIATARDRREAKLAQLADELSDTSERAPSRIAKRAPDGNAHLLYLSDRIGSTWAD